LELNAGTVERIYKTGEFFYEEDTIYVKLWAKRIFGFHKELVESGELMLGRNEHPRAFLEQVIDNNGEAVFKTGIVVTTLLPESDIDTI
jgi:hypothetical protein